MGGGSNPLQNDAELHNLMGDLDGLSNAEEFVNWRRSFVDRMEEFLGDEAGVTKARDANTVVLGRLLRLSKAMDTLQNNIDDDGVLKGGVKTQMALNKLKEGCLDMQKRLSALVPSNSSDIKTCGYSKFHLGAVLVKDGFVIYADMMHHEQILGEVVEPALEAAAVDRQILDGIQNYFKRIKILHDVLADLGLYKVMQKTREFIPLDEERYGKAAATLNATVAAKVAASPHMDQSINRGMDQSSRRSNTTERSAPATKGDTNKDQESGQQQSASPAKGGNIGKSGNGAAAASPSNDDAGATSASGPGTPGESSTNNGAQQPKTNGKPSKKAAAAADGSSSSAAKPKRASAKKKKPQLPGGGRRDSAATPDSGKRYAVGPPKKQQELTKLNIQRPIKQPGDNNMNNDGDGDDNQAFLIFYDPETKVMGKISKQQCIDFKILTPLQGTGRKFKEQSKDPQPLLKTIMEGRQQKAKK